MIKKHLGKTFFVDTLYYIAGSFLFGFGIYTFALNAHFTPGGISGIALMINHFTGWPIGTVGMALNLPLALLSLRVVGRAFTLKSFYTLLVSTLILDLVFPHIPTYSGNPLLAAMFTGILAGAGLAIIYMRGSSTGGSDFVILSIKKMRPHFSVGQITLAIDAAIVLCGWFVYGNVDAILYGIVSLFATTMAMDNILYGAGSSKLAVIITDFGEEIAKAISAEIDRGSTLTPATGAFTGKAKHMLLCVCSKSQIYKLRTAARAIDPGSMIIVTEASEVIGEGFAMPKIPGHEADAPKNSHTG